MFHKGDRVGVLARVTTFRGYVLHAGDDGEIIHQPLEHRKRYVPTVLVREPYSCAGVVIGKSYRATGWVYGGHGPDPRTAYMYDESPQLHEDKRHPVWMVAPMLHGDRYLKPIACQEEDLEPIPVDEIEIDTLALEILRDLYWCDRVWEAWDVGTMTEHDFISADEDQEVVEDTVALIKQFVRTHQ